MTEISKLTELRKLMQSMERTLGLEELSPVERDIYYAAEELSKNDQEVRTFGLIEHTLVQSVSRPTFFRALKSLVNKGYLSQSGSANRGRYLVHAPRWFSPENWKRLIPVHRWASDTFFASLAYVAASILTFEVLMPLQNMFFPQYPSHASLLFLPHGVRVLSAWLLGWRAIVALLPGVFIVFAMVGGWSVFSPSRLLAIAIAVTIVPAVFYASKALGWDLFPRSDRKPCWLCVMGVGVITSVLVSILTNITFGSSTAEYIAFLIGDFFGLLFLMLGLGFAFRFAERRS